MSASTEQSKHVVVIGAGGNIGSHVTAHLARMRGLVAKVTLIDRDVYEPANLLSQDIISSDVGEPKAIAQALKLHRINAQLAVIPVVESIEQVQLGRLRSDVILACLDSRIARQRVNESASRLGVPWIDAGVDGGGLLARVNVYLPGQQNACLECAWDDGDYAALEQAYPCLEMPGSPAPTNALSCLGALAASLQAIECWRLLTGGLDRAAAGQQVLIDAANHKHYVTEFRRNPRCRFPDHEPWTIEPLNCRLESFTLGDALEMQKDMIPAGSPALWIEGNRFEKRITCLGCGRAKDVLRLQSAISSADRRCDRCGQTMRAAGQDMAERLEAKAIPGEWLSLPLAKLGLRSGDVFSVGDNLIQAHFEIGAPSQSAPGGLDKEPAVPDAAARNRPGEAVTDRM